MGGEGEEKKKEGGREGRNEGEERERKRNKPKEGKKEGGGGREEEQKEEAVCRGPLGNRKLCSGEKAPREATPPAPHIWFQEQQKSQRDMSQWRGNGQGWRTRSGNHLHQKGSRSYEMSWSYHHSLV